MFQYLIITVKCHAHFTHEIFFRYKSMKLFLPCKFKFIAIHTDATYVSQLSLEGILLLGCFVVTFDRETPATKVAVGIGILNIQGLSYCRYKFKTVV